MSFQDSAFSLRARLHMGEVKPAVLIGVLLVAAVVLTCALCGVVSAATSPSFEVRTASQEGGGGQEGEAATDAVSDDDGNTVAEPALICVHVSGCVTNPGVFYVEEGSRVADAVEAAGGLAEDAASDAVNLARVLNDGEQVVIPSLEEARAAQELNASGASGADSYSSSGAGGLVNINTADSSQLQTLNGIGEATAEKIIKDREANGPYQTIEDIKRVSGIGDKKFENIKDSICVG